MRFAQLQRMRRSESAMTVRVFPAPSRHHEESLPFEVVLECLTDPANGSPLVVPLDDRVADLGSGE